MISGLSAIDYKVYRTKDSKEIPLGVMSKELLKYNVMFFGELHDDILLHQLEKELLYLLYLKNEKIAVSLEMFERDVQPVLNDYLKGKITETEFLEKSRPWPNYPTDYKPLVEYAKEKKLPVLASNVQRKYASMIAKQGKDALKDLSATEKEYIAKNLVVLDDDYKIKFGQTMFSNMESAKGSPMHSMIDLLYAAQCLKDDTMAESINNFIEQNKNYKVIHYNGSFHSDAHLGTSQKLALLNSDLKIAVIAPIAVEDSASLVYSNDYKTEGDYVIVYHRKTAETEVVEKKMPAQTNSILFHDIKIELNPNESFIKGQDLITFARPVTQQDTLYLLTSVKVSKISDPMGDLAFVTSTVDPLIQGISITNPRKSSKIKLEYAGTVFNQAEEINLKQTHQYSSGIISGAKDSGIYLPQASWYPAFDEGYFNYRIEASCPDSFALITSGRESFSHTNKTNNYVWTSELPADNLTLCGNRFYLKEIMADTVKLSVYLLEENKGRADVYLDQMKKNFTTYTKLLGKYPFSSFSLVENFFSSGFGMPNYTLITKEIIKMPQITNSPGVLAHEFVHNWYGNSIFVDNTKGNWCEALTNFCANYYWYETLSDAEKTREWREKSLYDLNLLSPEANYPLRDFKYQRNSDDAVIGYQKGAFLFYQLFFQMGEDKFFQALHKFNETYMGKTASWDDLQEIFHLPLIKQVLNEKELPGINASYIKTKEGTQLTIMQDIVFNQLLKVRIDYGTEKEDKFYFLKGKKLEINLETRKIVNITTDPDFQCLRKISKSEMPFSLAITLADNPILIYPAGSELESRIKMLAGMLSQSGYSIKLVSSDSLTTTMLAENSLFVFGNYQENKLFTRKDMQTNALKYTKEGFILNKKMYNSPSASLLLSCENPWNKLKYMSIFSWNNPKEITSFRRLFHYQNDSWFIFDNLLKKDTYLEKGSILRKKN